MRSGEQSVNRSGCHHRSHIQEDVGDLTTRNQFPLGQAGEMMIDHADCFGDLIRFEGVGHAD